VRLRYIPCIISVAFRLVSERDVPQIYLKCLATRACTNPIPAILHINIYIYIWPPLRSSGQSSLLQIQRSRFDSRSYQIFWKVVGLERGLLSLLSTTEELLERKRSCSGLEKIYYCLRGMRRADTLYLEKLALTSPTSGCRSVSIVRSRTKATEL
jgi:hypothetical protein